MIRSIRLALTLWALAFPVQAALPDPTRFGVAVETGDIASAREWLDAGLPPDFMGDRIGTGLMIAAWEGNIPMMALFLERGADIHRTNEHGEQALQLAAWKGRTEAVKWLIDRGATVNRTGNEWGALHYATFAGHREIARLLIGRGADVNARAPNESTVLMMAVHEGHEDLARDLLEAGADPARVNDRGDSALTWAMRYGHYSIAQLVSSPEAFARAAKAAPESFGPAVRSLAAPARISEILHGLRVAESKRQPAARLRKELFSAVEAFKKESRPLPEKARTGKPGALVITARPGKPGGERAELVYGRTSGKPGVAELLAQLRAAEAQGRPRAHLRKALMEAVAEFKKPPVQEKP